MYLLKQYDNILAKFNIYYDESGFRVSDFLIIGDKSKLPLNLDLSNEGMAEWLRKRSVPKNREFVDKFLSKLGLNHNNTKGIIDICKGLSLNDSYWVCEDDFNKSFKECNLYDNRFNNILGLIAFTGYGSSIKSKFMSSPELTTTGQLAKCWRRINGKIYLYKSGTTGYSNSGLEPYSEYYASQIANIMNINHVDYNLAKWKGKLCSTCKLFTDINHSYMPIGYLVNKGGMDAVIKYLKELGNDFFEAFVDMIVFDAVIMNTDRHYGNFGLIIDNMTNRPISFAPIFDNGAGLLPYAVDNDEFKSLDNLLEYTKTRNAVMYNDFIDTAKKYMTKRQKDMLKKLINFKFKKHSRYNLNDKRLKLLEKIIKIRIELLLN
ncbi:MAG: hypothetical protein K5892_01950 [Acholeplasmatales bacterium]|nr:hypothetical protein [Acholeplasmatales bacterium]